MTYWLHRQNVLRQNFLRTRCPMGQNVLRTRCPMGQNVLRTRCPMGQNVIKTKFCLCTELRTLQNSNWFLIFLFSSVKGLPVSFFQNCIYCKSVFRIRIHFNLYLTYCTVSFLFKKNFMVKSSFVDLVRS